MCHGKARTKASAIRVRCTVYGMHVTYSVQIKCTNIFFTWLIVYMYENGITYMYTYSNDSYLYMYVYIIIFSYMYMI